MQFTEGDRVRILRKVRTLAHGWKNSWVDSMDGTVGKIGIVVFVSSNLAHNVEVDVPGHGEWGYPDFALKLISPLSPRIPRKSKAR